MFLWYDHQILDFYHLNAHTHAMKLRRTKAFRDLRAQFQSFRALLCPFWHEKCRAPMPLECVFMCYYLRYRLILPQNLCPHDGHYWNWMGGGTDWHCAGALLSALHLVLFLSCWVALVLTMRLHSAWIVWLRAVILANLVDECPRLHVTWWNLICAMMMI